MSVQNDVTDTPVEDESVVKVFVGNLSFSTTDDDLAAAFAGTGNVLGASIITRYGRSLGYGFVSFASEIEAQKAVETMNKFEMNGRPLNVEPAKPMAKTAMPALGSTPRKRNNRRRPHSVSDVAVEVVVESGADAPATSGEDTPAAVNENESGPRRPRRPRRRPHSSASGIATDSNVARIDQQDENVAPSGEGLSAPSTNRRKRAPRRRGPKNASTDGAGENAEKPTTAAAPAGAAAAEVGENGEPQTNAPRRRNPKKPIGDTPSNSGPLSKTMLFVANLPFKVTSDDLLKIFGEYSVTSAKVVTLRNGRSKGFGFVEVSDEAEQGRVLRDLDASSLNVDGRDLIVRVALEAQTRDSSAAAPVEEKSAEATAEHAPPAPTAAPAAAGAAVSAATPEGSEWA